LVKAWEPTDHWKVGKYVVLPDHLHLFCSPMMGGRVSLARWVSLEKLYKSELEISPARTSVAMGSPDP
jgi:hypothetical protein